MRGLAWVLLALAMTSCSGKDCDPRWGPMGPAIKCGESCEIDADCDGASCGGEPSFCGADGLCACGKPVK